MLTVRDQAVYDGDELLGEYQDWRFVPSKALLESPPARQEEVDAFANSKLFFAFQLHDHAEGVELHVDTDPVGLWERLKTELNHARKYSVGVETLEVGQVLANDVVAALDEVRAERWVKGTHGYANGVTVGNEEGEICPSCNEPIEPSDETDGEPT